MDTGNWRVSPYSLYARDYMPFDKLGFGLDTTPPGRALPADMREIAKAFGPVHAAHTPAHLPRVLYDRWRFMFSDAFRGARLPLAVFAVVALAALPAAGWFAVASSLILTLCYLGYAHDASWDVYYLEILPLFPFLTACGIWTVWVGLARRGKNLRRNVLSAMSPQAAVAAAVIALLWLLPARTDVVQARREQASRRAYQLAFSEAVAKLPDAHTIVFIRYAPRHFVHTSLIANHADLSSARTWFVYDRGAEDAELMGLAPERAPYLFDERSGTLTRLSDRASNSP
jgi:hypothetical protein